MRVRECMVVVLSLLFLLPLGGCSYDFSEVLGIPSGSNQPELIKAKIYFTDGQSLETYIKDLGIQQDGKVYVGGSSLNYLYDSRGNIVGSYNYQRVLFIKVIPETEKKSS
ncbi:hypothetical protein ASZ90_019777 [hydrocarbon metagenome]|uniref:Uncharacterized protein n=1 Tax=hydrocarbon metagenome TaxID=938273 RepID=A0A0W8E2H6_9ZZZZ